MAAKDNQGLQAIVIVLALLVVGLAVGLFLINNSRKTELARADQAEEAASNASTAERKAQEEANNYKEWMGFARGESYDSTQQSINEDLALYGANFDEQDRNFRTILKQVYKENSDLAINESEAKKTVAQLQLSLVALEAAKEQEVKKYETKMNDLATDLANEKLKFEKQYAEINKAKQKIANDFDQLQQSHDETVAALNAAKSALEQKVVSLERSVELIKRQLPEKDPFAQPADGAITWVNQKYSKVWIDLGAADGLRPQVTFSVYEVGQPDAEQAVKKASVEVVRIIDAHMAEAKVTDDDPKNPLMPGDKLYSPVWEPGRTVGFGIAGFIDIDGDGNSDLEQLKRIIAASGGKVDVAPDAKGAKQGQAQVETRFLVLGKRPDEAHRTAWRASFDQISREASDLGIETVPLDHFLKLIGWQNDSDVVPLGIDARADDFAAQPRGQELPRKTGQPAGAFRKRLPKVSY